MQASASPLDEVSVMRKFKVAVRKMVHGCTFRLPTQSFFRRGQPLHNAKP